ncbi:hypothetical protein LPE509_00936 [Legionella pneumophila subsp. pneumophila LPE509]|nr:hypothetical protein LPE509_00936 [Legionella pneumophila subsp. pneumophila LPE509]
MLSSAGISDFIFQRNKLILFKDTVTSKGGDCFLWQSPSQFSKNNCIHHIFLN